MNTDEIIEQSDELAKRFEQFGPQIRVITVEGQPVSFVHRDRTQTVREVVGRWKVEGRWWEDGRDREYWRVATTGGAKLTALWDLYYDRRDESWHLERFWD